MKTIQVDNINNMLLNSLKLVKGAGRLSKSRSGEVYEVFDVDFLLKFPKKRHLSIINRKNNIFASIAELFWVFSGDNKINPFLSNFILRAKDFSDDGVGWRGAHGPRIFNDNQIENILRIFKKESLNTRRAVFSIWNSSKDSLKPLGVKDTTSSKDIPCVLCGNFWVKDNKLFLKVTMRSNDIFWGLSHIDILEWTFFQELILSLLNKELGCNLTLGYYHHSVANLHFYKRFLGRGNKIVETNNCNKKYRETDFFVKVPLIKPNIDKNIKKFFQKLIVFLNKYKEQNDADLMIAISYLNKIFQKNYDLEIENNIVYSYALLLLLHIHSEKKSELMVMEDVVYYINKFVPHDLKESVLSCEYTSEKLLKTFGGKI